MVREHPSGYAPASANAQCITETQTMNEVLLKSLAVAMIGMVVCSALWLAGSVQAQQRGAAGYRMADPKAAPKTKMLAVAAILPEHAASAAAHGHAVSVR